MALPLAFALAALPPTEDLARGEAEFLRGNSARFDRLAVQKIGFFAGRKVNLKGLDFFGHPPFVAALQVDPAIAKDAAFLDPLNEQGQVDRPIDLVIMRPDLVQFISVIAFHNDG